MSDVPQAGTMSAGELIDQLCDEFEKGWQTGQSPRIEDVVRHAPDSVRPDLFHELLALEGEYRSRTSRPITATEARERFSGFGPWVFSAIEELLGGTETGAGGPGSTAPGQYPVPLTRPFTARADLAPEVVGGYRIVRLLGSGGMGSVYLADDTLGRRQVAVKVMNPQYAANAVARERFLREARSAMSVEHDNVVAVYQVGVDGDTPFLVMPVLKGESLEDRLTREPLTPVALVLKVGREVALGLSAAHEKGLVHRDVKPANTWLEGDPASAVAEKQVRRAKVLDFGLARPTDGTDGVSVAGVVVGTPAYMAPEQAAGRAVDNRADLFSLGAVLYRMSTGRPAFAGPTLSAVLTAIATHNPPPPATINPGVPPALSALIVRLLEKEPDRRPASASEVVDALTGIEKRQSRTTNLAKRWMIGGGAVLALLVVRVRNPTLVP